MKIFQLVLAVAIALLAFYYRTPATADVRVWLILAIVAGSLGLMAAEIAFSKTPINPKTPIRFLIVAIASLGLFVCAASEFQFYWTKQKVFSSNPEILEKLGQHFIIGYRDFDELKYLVERRAIAGVFITTRNILNKTKEEIKQEIQTLQDIRQSQDLLPLWIATDQEGGMVSRLSPPLSKLPQLSRIVKGEEAIERKKEAVIKSAQQQGKELSELGVNLNFAPLVDINKGIINPNDKYSQIYQRAISADKDVVAKVALWYCQTLEQAGVRCTIKHFPGLGRVANDTHIQAAELPASVDELAKDDWVPFREVMSKSSALTMLGHAKLMSVDRDRPVSFSKPVVTGILRNNWQHNGILITDDFSMYAVYGSKDGLEIATVEALNAGVDLILFAFDKDLYYKAMYATIEADKMGSLDRAVLEKSQKRLNEPPRTPRRQEKKGEEERRK